MILKGLIDDDLINYKLPSMLLAMPRCTFKCDRECGKQVCQNSVLAQSTDIETTPEEIVTRYLSNNLTSAMVFAGLEPFDTFKDMKAVISLLRQFVNDTVVIYTGYNKNELEWQIESLRQYKNIVIKFGRFIPDKEHCFNDLLGVGLASPNQYAEKIS